MRNVALNMTVSVAFSPPFCSRIQSLSDDTKSSTKQTELQQYRQLVFLFIVDKKDKSVSARSHAAGVCCKLSLLLFWITLMMASTWNAFIFLSTINKTINKNKKTINKTQSFVCFVYGFESDIPSII